MFCIRPNASTQRLSVCAFYAVYLVLLSGIKHRLSLSLLGFASINLKQPALFFLFFFRSVKAQSLEEAPHVPYHTPIKSQLELDPCSATSCDSWTRGSRQQPLWPETAHYSKWLVSSWMWMWRLHPFSQQNNWKEEAWGRKNWAVSSLRLITVKACVTYARPLLVIKSKSKWLNSWIHIYRLQAKRL